MKNSFSIMYINGKYYTYSVTCVNGKVYVDINVMQK